MLSDDETVGRNVRALRDAAGLSQAKLAEAMTEAGVSGFYPQTVTKIERGSRALKLTEGLHLARILNVEPRDLYHQPATAADDQEVRRRANDLRSASEGIRELHWTLVTAETDLRSLLHSRTVSPEVRASAEMALRSSVIEATAASLSPGADADDPTDAELAQMHADRTTDEERMK